MKTKSAVCREFNKPYTIEEIEIEPPRQNEVMIKVAHTGWCHSDLSSLRGTYGLSPNILPMVPGHESAGVVHSVGPGGVGLNVVRGAALAQANPIIAVDLERSKEKIAAEMGSTHFIDSSKEDPVPIIKDLTRGKGVHYAFEVTGDVGASLQAFYTLRNGGRMMQIGIPSVTDMASFPLFIMPLQAQKVEGVLYGSLRHQVDVPILADMAIKGELKVDKLISRHFKLEELNGVVQSMEKREIIGRWICDL